MLQIAFSLFSVGVSGVASRLFRHGARIDNRLGVVVGVFFVHLFLFLYSHIAVRAIISGSTELDYCLTANYAASCR